MTIDDVRRYWSDSPCNIRRSSAKPGTLKFFWDIQYNKRYVEPSTREWMNFDEWSGKKVLEIGCGLGIDAIEFASHGARVTAIDLSSRSLDLAYAHACAMDVDHRIYFIQGDVERLSEAIPHQKFDLIYSFGALHHALDINKALQQLRWYSDWNTELRLMVYHKHSLKYARLLLQHGHNASKFSEAVDGSPVTHVYGKSEIRNILQDNGFHVTDMKVRHLFPYNIEAYRNHQYRKTWLWGHVPGVVYNALEKLFGWHLLITAVA